MQCTRRHFYLRWRLQLDPLQAVRLWWLLEPSLLCLVLWWLSRFLLLLPLARLW